MKRFVLFNTEYELVALAKDQGKEKLGKIVIYRIPNTQEYYTMPVSELATYVRSGEAERQIDINWNKRIALYKNRFVVRTDVYANRYFNKKMNKKAYAPAVPFENGRPMRTHFLPLTDEVISKHLQAKSKLAIGLYPLSIDNTTKFLAFDIDGHHEDQPWKELTKSLQKACQEYDLQPLVELSQSGKGCHVWLFFDTSIDAKKARQLGDGLFKVTQKIDSRLPFSAFDRLFPAQNQVGKGKIGNLIAAPLEGQSLNAGRTVFVDGTWKAFPDQWKVLQDVSLISLDKINKILNDITSHTSLELNGSNTVKDDDLFSEKFYINKSLTVIQKDALYLRKDDLSTEEILNLKWLASFRNPEFYKLQAVRMPVNNTPRIITLFKENDEYLILPRGLSDEINSIVNNVSWDEQTEIGTSLKVEFMGKLYPNQVPAYDAIRKKTTGILAARTGFGKTIIAAKLIANHKVSTLILVPNKVLAEQWKQKLTNFLEISSEPVIVEYTPTGRKKHKEAIGTYYGQKKNPSGLVDIATIQAISKMSSAREFLSHYGMVISDEVHHDAAYTFDEVINKIASKYLYGLSATPYRRDGQEPILTLRFGPIRFQTDVIDPRFALTVKRTVIPRFTNFGMTDLETLNNSIVENRLAIQNDDVREQMLIRDIEKCIKEKRHTIVLTSLVTHVDKLYDKLPKKHLYRIYGGISNKERSKEILKINSDKEPYTILATPYVGGEGLDIPSLDTMILSMPYSFHGNLEQYLGRMHRDLDKKKDLKVIDYVDMFVPMLLRMFRKRKQVYKKMGYVISDDEYTHQSGLKVFSGNYKNQLSKDLDNAQNVLIMTSTVKPFLQQYITRLIGEKCKLHIYSRDKMQLFAKTNIQFTQYEYNLPNCIIIDDCQMWISSDLSFDFDTGLTTRIDHPELIKQFKKVLLKDKLG